jgi:hypothetical protein
MISSHGGRWTEMTNVQDSETLRPQFSLHILRVRGTLQFCGYTGMAVMRNMFTQSNEILVCYVKRQNGL